MAVRSDRRRQPSRPFDGASCKRARLERSCRPDSFPRIFRAEPTLGSTREAARAAICSPVAARLENHDRGFHGSPRCIGIEVLIDLLPSSPQTSALVTVCRPAGDLAGPAHEIHGHVGMCLKVQPPSRIGAAPTVHSHGDEVRAVLKVADHDRVDSACPPPDGPKTHGAPTAGLRPPQTESAPRRAVHAAVADPEKPDKPAGRKRRLLGPQLRHVIDDARAWQARPSTGKLGTHRRTTTDGRFARPLATTRDCRFRLHAIARPGRSPQIGARHQRPRPAGSGHAQPRQRRRRGYCAHRKAGQAAVAARDAQRQTRNSARRRSVRTAWPSSRTPCFRFTACTRKRPWPEGRVAPLSHGERSLGRNRLRPARRHTQVSAGGNGRPVGSVIDHPGALVSRPSRGGATWIPANTNSWRRRARERYDVGTGRSDSTKAIVSLARPAPSLRRRSDRRTYPPRLSGRRRICRG